MIKKWKHIVLALIVFYVVFNLLGKMTCIYWVNPMINTLVELRHSQDPDKKLTIEEVHDLISKTSYDYAGWSYNASLEGEGTNWTLRFDPAPMTLWRRVWWAVAYWNLHPNRWSSYEMRSDTMSVTHTTWDGRTFNLMNNEKKQHSEPEHARQARPSQTVRYAE